MNFRSTYTVTVAVSELESRRINFIRQGVTSLIFLCKYLLSYCEPYHRLRRHNATFCQLHEMSTDGHIYFSDFHSEASLFEEWFGFADQIVMSGST